MEILMQNILLFGGTTEGRKLTEYCCEKHLRATVCVTTDYGAGLLRETDNVRILVGKKDKQAICDLLAQAAAHEQYSMVIDATHPYAVEASRNIRAACEQNDVPYYRVIRPVSEDTSNGIYFDTLDALIAYINTQTDTEDKILVTTGSKELPVLRAIEHYEERCVTRLLPNTEIQEKCLALGYRKDQMILEKGPFSVEKNCAQIGKFSIQYLITKDSGDAGGFPQKIEAVRRCGIRALVLRRPKEQGYTPEQIINLLEGTQG